MTERVARHSRNLTGAAAAKRMSTLRYVTPFVDRWLALDAKLYALLL